MKVAVLAVLLCILAASSVAQFTFEGRPRELPLPHNTDLEGLQQFNVLKKEAWNVLRTMTPNIQLVKPVMYALISAKKGLKKCSQHPEDVDCVSREMQQARAVFKKIPIKADHHHDYYAYVHVNSGSETE